MPPSTSPSKGIELQGPSFPADHEDTEKSQLRAPSHQHVKLMSLVRLWGPSLFSCEGGEREGPTEKPPNFSAGREAPE